MPRTMVSPLGFLRQEHQVVQEQLSRLEEALPRLAQVSGPAAERSREVLVEIASFLRQELELHLLKEEVALFSPLEKVLGESIGPIAAMRAEHDGMRENNRALQHLLSKLEAAQDEVDTRRELEEIGVTIIGLIRRHLDQEDRVVFRLAEEMLSPRTLRAVVRKMTSMAHQASTQA